MEFLQSLQNDPDFSTGGEIIYRREEMEKIIETGLGSFQIRSRWRWIPEERIIEVYEIPYTTKTDVIIERIVKLSKEGKVKEIADIRDETDLSGLRIAIDLKRGVDPDKLMAKLYRSTTLQDSFSCNFNVLVDGYPRVMGVRQILHEWVKWRIESTRRRINFDLGKKSERLHLLHGLEAILLDIDKAIAIIRGTKLEAEVVPNLMKGFVPANWSRTFARAPAQPRLQLSTQNAALYALKRPHMKSVKYLLLLVEKALQKL